MDTLTHIISSYVTHLNIFLDISTELVVQTGKQGQQYLLPWRKNQICPRQFDTTETKMLVEREMRIGMQDRVRYDRYFCFGRYIG